MKRRVTMYNYTNRYFNRFRPTGENPNNNDWCKGRVEGVAPVPRIDTITYDFMCMSIAEYDGGRFIHGLICGRIAETRDETRKVWNAKRKQDQQDIFDARRAENAKQDAFEDMLEEWKLEIASRK